MKATLKFFSIFILLALSTPALAKDIDKAQDDPEGALIFIENLSNSALSALDDMSLTQEERDHTFRELLREGFDLSYIGKLVLGRHWRSASREQKSEFERIFPEYVLQIYANRLRERGDETFEVKNSVPAGKKDVYIRSEIIRPDGPPVAADWRVRYRSENFKVVDLKIEGISMVITQREEFASRINQIGLDGLIEEIRVKSQIDAVQAEAEAVEMSGDAATQAP